MVVDAASRGTIDPGSKADIRLAYQPPHLSPLRTLVRLRRSLVSATRGLRRWDQPFESSSIIELDTEPHRGIRRSLILFLLLLLVFFPLVSLTAVVFRASPSTSRSLPFCSPSARNSRTRDSFKTTHMCTPFTCPHSLLLSFIISPATSLNVGRFLKRYLYDEILVVYLEISSV